MKKSERLHPCPFCGGRAEARKKKRRIANEKNPPWLIQCSNPKCFAESGVFLSQTDAVAAWNRRTPIRQKIS
ncbi:MAG: hypothetical protein UY23_C0001G0035 [Candidatus Jorgensenbacteria bacterium GW2011_GWA1_48_11]|uniref:Restriction alleviation protein, Lar family n=1 Tax=Candidatus Jorgensenbacteria bacterium GW2011_GWA1_48_11 TaxID=1618660 RepID=A0A0G1UBD3_9BACT|nr:MAG: hypothetical protein UY23_C0001G0035 [Candidatus Jorgensenbacteria bacterium GW2011_GWA1_48_11]KKW11924.1 MAG: hypothetical protein UY51_C0005G0166 [Candidatus Jorgensenbacteria bacterium GW2011_GWB1_49_9]